MRIFVENKFMVVPRKWGNQCCWQSRAKRVSIARRHPVLILLTKYREAWLWEHKFRNDIISSIHHIRTYHTACVYVYWLMMLSRCVLQTCSGQVLDQMWGLWMHQLPLSVSESIQSPVEHLQQHNHFSQGHEKSISQLLWFGGKSQNCALGYNYNVHFCLQCLRITMYNTSNRTRWQKSYVIWGKITKWYIVHGAFTLLVKTLLCAYKMPIACHLQQYCVFGEVLVL